MMITFITSMTLLRCIYSFKFHRILYPDDVYLEMRTTWNDGEVCRRKQKYFAKIVIAMEIVAGTVERVLAFPSTANDRRDAHRTDSWVHCYWRRWFIVGAHLLITISQVFIELLFLGLDHENQNQATHRHQQATRWNLHECKLSLTTGIDVIRGRSFGCVYIALIPMMKWFKNELINIRIFYIQYTCWYSLLLRRY